MTTARVIGTLFWLYVATLILASRWLGHTVFEGWWARLVTLGGIGLGLLPWSHWLRPRLMRALGVLGRAALVGCYFTLLAPFALLIRFLADPLRIRRPRGLSYWMARRPLPNAVDAAHLEY